MADLHHGDGGADVLPDVRLGGRSRGPASATLWLSSEDHGGPSATCARHMRRPAG